MSHAPAYPKRLIEVDLPIKKISEHARREKSIRHGHISTLHIWWARRPLAACRAVICGALWPDPADEHCPEAFRSAARARMAEFWNPTGTTPRTMDSPLDLRKALLDFIADFANWDHSTDERYLNTARALTQSAHEALGGEPGTRPLVVDPFAGGGSIPLEALRIGADAYASDLNPVAVLLNKVVLEYIPKYGKDLADDVRKWGRWIKDEAEKELAEFYPKDPDGATPIAYLWARTVQCDPASGGCGAEVPLIRSLWLAKKGNRSVALRLIPDKERKRVEFEIIEKAKPSDVKEGTVKRGSVTCPCCDYTTPVTSVRAQLKAKHGGADEARLFCVVTTKQTEQGRFYRLPNEGDLETVRKAKKELDRRKREWKGALSLAPDEPTPIGGGSGAGRAFSQRNYGMNRFEDLFTSRQLLALTTFVRLSTDLNRGSIVDQNKELQTAIQTGLSLAVDRLADKNASLTVWNNIGEKIEHVFSRQALSMTWDFPEVGIFSDSTGNWMSHVLLVSEGLDIKLNYGPKGHSELISALNSPLPNESANLFFTDPPYYDAVPYADLSDFFYVWLKRTVGDKYDWLIRDALTPKMMSALSMK
jgi:adenine-specific DNA methylase